MQLNTHLYILYRPVFPIDVLSVIPDRICEHVESMLQGVGRPKAVAGRSRPRFLARNIDSLPRAVIAQQGLGCFSPLLLLAMGFDFLQPGPVKIQQAKHLFPAFRCRTGDQEEEYAK